MVAWSDVLALCGRDLFCTDLRFRSTLPVLGSANVVSVDLYCHDL